MHRLTALIPLLLGSVLSAQRETASFEHQKRTVAVQYGGVIVGKRGLAELPVGQGWHLNTNENSSWRLETPLLAGDKLIAPGNYKASIQRTGEAMCAMQANGSAMMMGGSGDWEMGGAVGKCAKPTKRLEFAWRKKGALEFGNQPAQLVLQFGDIEWVGDVTVLGSKEIKLAGWKGVAFAVPAARVEAGPVPIATLTKGTSNWNLILDKTTVKLVPWMVVPTDHHAELPKPDESATVTGKVEPLEAKVEKAKEVVEVTAAKVEKGEIVIDAVFAQQGVRLVLPEPKAKAGK